MNPGIETNNASVRVHIPEFAKEELTQNVREATEIFLKKVMLLRRAENERFKESN